MEVYKTVRGITGIGAGKGPVLTIADGFVGYGSDMIDGGWNGFLPGSDRVALDVHTYLAFAPPNDDGIMFQASKVSGVDLGWLGLETDWLVLALFVLVESIQHESS